MAYQLLALDMDGTLLTSRKDVSPATRRALESLAQAKTPIAFCTGRCFRELMDLPEQLPFIAYGVLASGAVVYDFAAGRQLDLRPIPAQVVLDAMRIAQQEPCMPHVMTLRESVARPSDYGHMDRFGMGVYAGMFERICTPAEQLDEWVRQNPGNIIKVNFYHATAQARDRTRARIQASGLPLTLANAESGSVECSAQGVSKAQGLRTLADYLGIAMQDVVAVGDSDNDLAALEAVGMPVAMGNASQSVRDVARMVVADNDHDGIAQVVRELFSIGA